MALARTVCSEREYWSGKKLRYSGVSQFEIKNIVVVAVDIAVAVGVALVVDIAIAVAIVVAVAVDYCY